MNILTHDSVFDPTPARLACHRLGLLCARDALDTRLTPRRGEVSDPRIAILEANRAAILGLIEYGDKVAAELQSPALVHESCGNEGCHHPACRDDQDRRNQLGDELLAAKVADAYLDHPKANPMPSVREFSQAWDA